MAKKKIIKEPEIQIKFNDFNKIYIYIRDHKKLNPIPWVFKIDTNKIKKLKAL